MESAFGNDIYESRVNLRNVHRKSVNPRPTSIKNHVQPLASTDLSSERVNTLKRFDGVMSNPRGILGLIISICDPFLKSQGRPKSRWQNLVAPKKVAFGSKRVKKMEKDGKMSRASFSMWESKELPPFHFRFRFDLLFTLEA